MTLHGSTCICNTYVSAVHVQSLVGSITLDPAAPPEQPTQPLPTSADTAIPVVTATADIEAVDATVEPQPDSQTGVEETVLTPGSLAGVSETSSHADLEDLAIEVSPSINMLHSLQVELHFTVRFS